MSMLGERAERERLMKSIYGDNWDEIPWTNHVKKEPKKISEKISEEQIMREFNQGIQWAQLEEITNKHSEETQLVVKVYHSLEDTPLIKLVPSSKCAQGKVYIGAFNAYDIVSDMSYETKCAELEIKLKKLQKENRELRDSLDTIRSIVT